LHIIQLIERKDEKVNVRHILIKPRIQGPEILQAQHICDSLKKAIEGTDTLTFSEAATRHSDDVESRNNGGLMINPYSGSSKFELDQLDPAVYVAIENLKEGEISRSAPYSTRDGKKGYAIYYLLKKQDSHKANLTQDYQLIHEAALGAKSEEAAKKWIADRLKTTYTNIQGPYQKCNFDNNWEKVN
jgi:peptidyl-prolyl cis-trans isomerase SurA